jgi:hypothetical protein
MKIIDKNLKNLENFNFKISIGKIDDLNDVIKLQYENLGKNLSEEKKENGDLLVLKLLPKY